MSMSEVYHEEAQKLKSVREMMDNPDISPDDYKAELSSFADAYETLLDQTKVITKISDRLQNKLNKTNDELKETNVKLNNTINELTLTKIDRKAKFIAYISVIILFLIVEVFIEPSVDYLANNKWVGLLVKTLITLLIKPFEEVFEHFLLKSAGFKLHKS